MKELQERHELLQAYYEMRGRDEDIPFHKFRKMQTIDLLSLIDFNEEEE